MKQISFRDDILPLKDLLYRLALRITRGSSEAEDIVQETMIKVWNKRDHWQEIESIEAFSLTICRNLSLDWLRHRGLIDATSDDDASVLPDNRSLNPLDRAQQTDSIRLVRSIVDALPEKQRSCVQLRDFEGKSYKEISTVLGISEDQVKINIFRARQTIKQQFTKLNNYGL